MFKLSKQKFQTFYDDPFTFMDNLNLKLKFIDFNIFKRYIRLRKTILILSMISLVAWIIFGFDSTPLQFFDPLIELAQGTITADQFWTRYNYYYGKEMHYSAFVIYGLMFYFLSKHFDKFNIAKSKNVCYSVTITLFSVGLFEFYWMYSFAFWQNQPWITTWQMPQLRILLQNLAFLTFGSIGLFVLWIYSFDTTEQVTSFWSLPKRRFYMFNWNKKALVLICACVGFALLWWFYPFPVNRITVQLSNGVLWVNNNHFPQTLYTVKTDVASAVNAGEWFYVEDNLVHALNTFIKFLWTYTVGYICLIREVKMK